MNTGFYGRYWEQEMRNSKKKKKKKKKKIRI
jgi:hypothetical protein